MNGYAFFVGGMLPYLAVTIFVIGMGYRFTVWARTPQPGKMTLFPSQEGATLRLVLGELLFFPSLFKGDRVLWYFSWVFHAALALVFLGHFRVFTGLIDQFLYAVGISKSGVDTMSATLGGAAGVVLLTTVLLLLIRRFASQRVREISGTPDFFALFLLIAVILSGDLMRFGAHFSLSETRVWAVSLLTFSPEVPAKGMFLTHALFAQVLFMYVPFSKLMHFGGFFFTHALIKRR